MSFTRASKVPSSSPTDDPTSELDPDTADLVAELVTRAVSRGACCLTATHDEALAERCNRTVRL